MRWAFGILLVFLAASPAIADDQGIPPFAQRGLRGPGHEAMDVLVGDWDVVIELYIAGGTPEAPLAGKLTARRISIGGDRFVYDVTTGELANGAPYWRAGTLGFSGIDQAYEWVTQDGLNANMMIYRAEPASGPGFPATLTGTFTDQGLLGESYVGATIRQRTVIEVDDADHHRVDLYFTPPGEAERLIGRMTYTRAAELTIPAGPDEPGSTRPRSSVWIPRR